MKILNKVLFFCAVSVLLFSNCGARQTMTASSQLQKKSDIVTATGGNGDSYETAVILNGGKNYTAAIEYEDFFIAKTWGVKNKDWKTIEQSTVFENKRKIDMLQIEVIKTGEKHFFFFDVNSYQKKQAHKTPQ